MMKGGEMGKETKTDTLQVNSTPLLGTIESWGILLLPREHGVGETTHIEV